MKDHNNDCTSKSFTISGRSTKMTNSEISFSDTASSIGRGDGKNNNLHQNEPKLAEREQRAVNFSKTLVICVLVFAACAMAFITYIFVRNEEIKDFEVQFENYASEIIAVTKENVVNTFGTIEAFSNSITAFAVSHNLSWPNVTVSDFTSRADRVAKLASSARLVTFAPFVQDDEKLAFEEYARQHIHAQVQESLNYQDQADVNASELELIPDVISYVNITTRETVVDDLPGPFLVNWQRVPFKPNTIRVMNNMLRVPTIASAVAVANETRAPALAFFEGVSGIQSQVIQPIYDRVRYPQDTEKPNIVGVVWVVMVWGKYFQNLLPENAKGIDLVMRSSCGFETTYRINGLEAEFIGLTDEHDPKYDHLEVSSQFFNFQGDETNLSPDICIDHLSLHLYPTDDLLSTYKTRTPLLYTTIVVAIFFFTSLVFYIYDASVRRRQWAVMQRVLLQNKIVSDVFPAKFRDRLYGLNDEDSDTASNYTTSRKLLTALDPEDVQNPDILHEKPIADLFLDSTVLFADISGFTAWSSAREPSQVFMLLESIYGAFDKIANRHQVFKVETVGDCFVAVAGVPDPRPDHAVAMAKFARTIMDKMKDLTNKLEISLGPDTGDLCMRIGLHSGQVTGGVLRGERSRFQLFGDTVNVASRMESTSKRNRIQITNVTAELLCANGRRKWVSEREDRILVHGKGNMKTFWLETKKESALRERRLRQSHALESSMLKGGVSLHGQTLVESSDDDDEYFIKDGNNNNDDDLVVIDNDDDASETERYSEAGDSDSAENEYTAKMQRLVEWNVDLLSRLLEQIIAASNQESSSSSSSKQQRSLHAVEQSLGKDSTVLEEFKEIISLPKVGVEDLKKRKDPKSVILDDVVVDQLRDYITQVASLYRDNDFHNFEHASHVTASVAKLLSRIVNCDSTTTTTNNNNYGGRQQGLNSNTTLEEIGLVDLSGHSYGITSDPLTQFAVVFSAIIHDAHHPGVPNAQLVKEKVDIASKYKEKSVAEQNSVDLCWSLLMQPKYKELRYCIYKTENELRRFRQLVVNTVMATDIVDKELGALRKNRWNEAFSTTPVDSTPQEDMNRKATIVIEHLIQASDISHTMQHWQVYKKWNERFFMECYGAYKAGRAESDPSIGWYKGEIGFFDFYVIPLAKKLDTCGVFGVSSHEYLNYATANRDEWVSKGEDIVAEYIQKFNDNMMQKGNLKPSTPTTSVEPA